MCLPAITYIAKFKVTVTKATITSDTNCKFREFPQMTFPFANSWQRLRKKKKTLKDIILIVMVYYREKIMIKTSQRKTHIGQSLHKFQTQMFRTHYPPSIDMWQFSLNIYCQPGNFTQALTSRVFTGASLCMHDWLINCLPVWTQFQGQLILYDLNHTVALSVVFSLHLKSIRYSWLRSKIWHKPPPLTNAILLGMTHIITQNLRAIDGSLLG